MPNAMEVDGDPYNDTLSWLEATRRTAIRGADGCHILGSVNKDRLPGRVEGHSVGCFRVAEENRLPLLIIEVHLAIELGELEHHLRPYYRRESPASLPRFCIHAQQ